MHFNGFTNNDFDTFQIEGLEERMAAIQTRIQPKFKALGDVLTDDVSAMVGSEMYLHIARHARRTVNPPKDTWLAIAGNKRGYKKHPHFQVGLFDDRLFIWLAFIYELPQKAQIAQTFLDHQETIENSIPSDFVISQDHMNKAATAVKDIDLEQVLERFRTVKKAELLIGKQINATDPILKNGDKLLTLINTTFKQLVPIYRLAYS